MTNTTFLVPPCVGVSPAAFLEFVQPDLVRVEARLQEDVGREDRLVALVARHLLLAGGKRLRPAMVALAARAVEPDCDGARIAVIGAVVEFVHMATLVHDDVVDDTATRRGKPTANAVFGNGAAVLSGDYILARAMRLLAIDGDLRLFRTVAEITAEMSEGEVMEIAATGRADLPIAEYTEIVRKKTAAFVEGCCRCGAVVAHADESTEEALGRYGYSLGMAFQIADDLLDYTGDPEVTGKPRGTDLRDGRATLPFLLAMPAATESERAQLLSALGNDRLDEAGFHATFAILEEHGAFDRTRAEAREYVDQANQALSQLPASLSADCLTMLTEFVVQRDR
ncbi:MAG: polyprenyl synthetase family protein [Armatimonadetes bacterium]|nr:polyprenyl synthetase family protein [Armatimonadota bacterium]MDE2207965.1 polyprenyl synthetase family protein [Armatimonadota bacterium]